MQLQNQPLCCPRSQAACAGWNGAFARNLHVVSLSGCGAARATLDCTAAAGARKVLWHNMREEPVLYINGRPYVVREADKPFQNLEYTGIDRSRVEDMEARLKRDVLDEVRRKLGLRTAANWQPPPGTPHITWMAALGNELRQAYSNEVPLRMCTFCTQDRPSDGDEPHCQPSGCCC